MELNRLEGDNSAVDLGFLEFTLLGPINAIIYSSIVFAAECNLGIQLSDGVLRCDFPNEVCELLGLEAIDDGVQAEQEHHHLLRLAPLSPEKLAHTPSTQYRLWQRVFPDHAPYAVLSIEINNVHNELHWIIIDSWLVWDWKLSTIERIDLSKQANERLDIVHSDPDWLTFTKQAVHDHPRALAEQLLKRGAMPSHIIEELERYNNAG